MSNPYFIFPFGWKYVKSNPILKPWIPLSLNTEASSSKDILYDDHAKFPSINTGELAGIRINSDPIPFESQFSSEIP